MPRRRFGQRNLVPKLYLAMKPYIHAALLLFAPLASVFAQSGRLSLQPIYPNAAPVCSPDELKKVVIPNTTIESVTVDERDGAVRVTAIVTHPPANDRVKVWVALPMKNWNGRFRGNGGGGFMTGNADSLRGASPEGFAAAATDGGHEGGSGSFALHASGRLNWQEIRDFAYLGIHEMTVVGKALTQAFYGKAPRYSYFVGSSTGGRQGLMEAQRYPADYDGIFSGCPAINWASMVPSTLWPQVVMHDAKHLVSKEKLEAVTAAAIAACDRDDGVSDGVIDDPEQLQVGSKGICRHDSWRQRVHRGGCERCPKNLGRSDWVTKDASSGMGCRAARDLVATAGTEGMPLKPKPFGIAVDWFRYFLTHSPGFDGTDVTAAEFELLREPVRRALRPGVQRHRPRPLGLPLSRRQNHHLAWPGGPTDPA